MADRKNQGEGDYEAARRYREQVDRHKKEKDVDAEARDAEKALDRDKGDLTSAEAKGKARAHEIDPEAKKP